MGNTKRDSFETRLRLVLGRGEILEEDYADLHAFCNVVFSRHFSRHHAHLKDDLIQEGLLGISDLAANGNFKFQMSAINFAYTKVRNHMSHFAYKKSPTPFTDMGEDETISEVIPDDRESDMVHADQILIHMERLLRRWGVSGDAAVFVRRNFTDRVGVRNTPVVGMVVNEETLEEYQFYLSALEFDLFAYFTDSQIYHCSLKNLLNFDGFDNTFRVLMRCVSSIVPEEDAVRLMYALSGSNMKFPSKARLRKVDVGMKIAKDFLDGDDILLLARRYNKSKHFIETALKTHCNDQFERMMGEAVV